MGFLHDEAEPEPEPEPESESESEPESESDTYGSRVVLYTHTVLLPATETLIERWGRV